MIQKFFHNILVVAFFCAPILVFAQTDQMLLEQKSYGFGLMVKSNGIGLNYQHQVATNKRFGRYYYADFGSFKHTNESKIVNHKVENKMPFVYGKMFHTATIRGALGVSLRLTKPSKLNNITVDLQAATGFTLGVQRPVYLRIETIENDQKTVKNVPYTRELVPNSENIIGYAKNGEGWSELKYRPGMAGVFNVAFSWDQYAQVAKRLNLGASLDYYPQGLPIMAFRPNPKLNATFFVGFMWVINQG